MPILHQDLEPFWNGFHVLSSSRQSGFGVGCIPYSEIIAYINEQNITNHEERAEFIKWIQYIDNIFVKKSSDDKKSANKAAKKKKPKQKK